MAALPKRFLKRSDFLTPKQTLGFSIVGALLTLRNKAKLSPINTNEFLTTTTIKVSLPSE